jgi:hypothetical protein
MVWLNANLACFFTMVAAITEAIQHVFAMRRHGLMKTLDQLFEQVIWPRAASVATATKEAIKEDFLDRLTTNLAVEAQDGRLSDLRTWFAPRQPPIEPPNAKTAGEVFAATAGGTATPRQPRLLLTANGTRV